MTLDIPKNQVEIDRGKASYKATLLFYNTVYSNENILEAWYEASYVQVFEWLEERGFNQLISTMTLATEKFAAM